MKKFSLFLLAVAFATSCQLADKASSYGSSSTMDYLYEAEAAMDAEKSEAGYFDDEIYQDPDDFAQQRIGDKVIKTANISVETEDYLTSIQRMRQAVKDCGAYISSENETNYSYRKGNTLSIRVEADKFEKLVDLLVADEEKVLNKTINAVDVSEEFVDIQARLKAKKEVEQRYLELLKQARTIEEILEIENHVRIIREEIDAKEGRLKFLKDQVAYSTISISVYQNFDDLYEDSFGDKSGDALAGGWEGFKMVLVVILYMWPLWLAALIALALIIFIIRKRRRAK